MRRKMGHIWLSCASPLQEPLLVKSVSKPSRDPVTEP